MATSRDSLLPKLQRSIKHAQNICLLGANNKIEDVWHTGGWSFIQAYRYESPGEYVRASQLSKEDHFNNSYYDAKKNEAVFRENLKWYYHTENPEYILAQQFQSCNPTPSNPLFDSTFNLNKGHHLLIAQALRAMNSRYGNCGAKSALVGKYLWENSADIEKIEYIATDTFNHVFVAVNRTGDILDPSTWGNAWFIDAWYGEGVIFPANEFKNKIKEMKQYVKKQHSEYKKIKIEYELVGYVETDVDTWRVALEIQPKIHLYPTYSKHFKVEDYYILEDYRYNRTPKWVQMNIDQTQHKTLFKDCLAEVSSLQNSAAFFQRRPKRAKPDLLPHSERQTPQHKN